MSFFYMIYLVHIMYSFCIFRVCIVYSDSQFVTNPSPTPLTEIAKVFAVRHEVPCPITSDAIVGMLS